VSNPWDPQVTVSPSLAIALINTQCPPLAPVLLEPFGAGWDNTAYLVNGEWVFRFPRREIAVDLLETEMRVLPRLAPRLPLPVPRPEWRGRPDANYPWPFAGYRLLPGRVASNAGLDDAARAAMARPLGEFLKALHSVDVREAEQWGAGPDVHARLDEDRLRTLVVPRLDDLVARVAIASADSWLEIFERGVRAPLSEVPALVHGDLYSRHLLVDDRDAICGVIDFGDLHVGQPALDLSIAWSLLPVAARPAFFEAYGAVSESVAEKARLRALVSAVSQEAYGRAVGDTAIEQEGLRALRCLLAE